jgi:hypothetical protein
LQEKRRNYAGSENHSPHYLKKKSHFDTGYRKTPTNRIRIKSMQIRRVADLGLD